MARKHPFDLEISATILETDPSNPSGTADVDPNAVANLTVSLYDDSTNPDVAIATTAYGANTPAAPDFSASNLNAGTDYTLVANATDPSDGNSAITGIAVVSPTDVTATDDKLPVLPNPAAGSGDDGATLEADVAPVNGISNLLTYKPGYTISVAQQGSHPTNSIHKKWEHHKEHGLLKRNSGTVTVTVTPADAKLAARTVKFSSKHLKATCKRFHVYVRIRIKKKPKPVTKKDSATKGGKIKTAVGVKKSAKPAVKTQKPRPIKKAAKPALKSKKAKAVKKVVAKKKATAKKQPKKKGSKGRKK
jgi:hypothetical protein